MGAETEHLKGQELPVKREKLDALWQKAWELVQKEVENPTDERIMFIKEGHLVEIESLWDSDSLHGISIKSWPIYPPYDLMIQPKILKPEAEAYVYNPGVMTFDKQDLERWRFDGDVTSDWVEGISFSLSQLLGEVQKPNYNTGLKPKKAESTI